ncbi:12548_t:CDS:2 [Funneliformis geosporum]|nr:12548_t:CDS:2 [Funneliformis geosporum]
MSADKSQSSLIDYQSLILDLNKMMASLRDVKNVGNDFLS